ncbi:MAG: small multi-drug export protein, partial [Clostridia bacterium]|nr:small multi-drug export protein [Clostridia bacterium]
CVVGNMLPIPFILLLIRKILEWLKKTKAFAKLANKIEARAKEKSGDLEKKKLNLKILGLFLFVGIPLPGTGAWTGALVADALDLRMKFSLPIITLGVILAGVIVSLIGYGIPAII